MADRIPPGVAKLLLNMSAESDGSMIVRGQVNNSTISAADRRELIYPRPMGGEHRLTPEGTAAVERLKQAPNGMPQGVMYRDEAGDVHVRWFESGWLRGAWVSGMGDEIAVLEWLNAKEADRG